MTGISGFVGSGLAVKFLQNENVQVISISNNEKDSERIKSILESVLIGFNYDVNDIMQRFIHVYINDLGNKQELEQVFNKYRPQEVWHIAANMSYDLGQFNKTIQFNVVDTGILYQIASNYCEKFFYISTIGVAGPGITNGYELAEDLILEFDSLNPYTISKCFSEHLLYNICDSYKSKLIILRLSSVIGHSKTGWVNDTKFGYYSYLHILKKYIKRDTTYYFNLNPDSKLPVIHIDHLVDVCNTLRFCNNLKSKQIFNLVNSNLLTVQRHFQIFTEESNSILKICYGEGIEGSNIMFNKINEHNNLFMSTKNTFCTKQLESLIGKEKSPPDLSNDSIKNVIRGYLYGRTVENVLS